MKVPTLPTEIDISARKSVTLMFGGGGYTDSVLARWGCGLHPSFHEPARVTGYACAQESLELLDGALKSLSSKQGPRADAARSYIKGYRDKILSAMSAYSEVTRCHDPHPIPNSDRIEKLTEQLGIADSEYQAAKLAYEGGTNADDVATLRDTHDRCRAKLNAVVREIRTLVDC